MKLLSNRKKQAGKRGFFTLGAGGGFPRKGKKTQRTVFDKKSGVQKQRGVLGGGDRKKKRGGRGISYFVPGKK